MKLRIRIVAALVGLFMLGSAGSAMAGPSPSWLLDDDPPWACIRLQRTNIAACIQGL